MSLSERRRNPINPFKFIFMYNSFGDDDAMFNYIQSYFKGAVIIKPGTYYQDEYHPEGSSLWVAEDIYNYVYAVFNSHAVYDESGEFEVLMDTDCEEWKKDHIERGMIEEVL